MGRIAGREGPENMGLRRAAQRMIDHLCPGRPDAKLGLDHASGANFALEKGTHVISPQPIP